MRAHTHNSYKRRTIISPAAVPEWIPLLSSLCSTRLQLRRPSPRLSPQSRPAPLLRTRPIPPPPPPPSSACTTYLHTANIYHLGRKRIIKVINYIHLWRRYGSHKCCDKMSGIYGAVKSKTGSWTGQRRQKNGWAGVEMRPEFPNKVVFSFFRWKK